MVNKATWTKEQIKQRLKQIEHLLVQCGWDEGDEEFCMLELEQKRLKERLLNDSSC